MTLRYISRIQWLTKISLTVLVLTLWTHPVDCAVSIVDDAGKTVTLPTPAVRIVPLYASISEFLVDLELRDRIVARTVSDDIAPANIAVVGTHMRPNFEIIAGARPDLIVMLEGREEAGVQAERLTALGFAVARFRISSFAELFSCIERLGILTDSSTTASQAIASMQDQVTALRADGLADADKPRIFCEVRYPNLLAAGGHNMLSDIIHLAGGHNSLAEYPHRMVRLSEETLIAFNPDIYIVLQGPMNKAPIAVSERPHFQTLDAVRRNRVYYLPEEELSRPGRGSINALFRLGELCEIWRNSRLSTPYHPRKP